MPVFLCAISLQVKWTLGDTNAQMAECWGYCCLFSLSCTVLSLLLENAFRGRSSLHFVSQVLLPFRVSLGTQLTNPLNLLRCFPMCVFKSLRNLSEERLPLSWRTLYLIKPLLCAWRTAWLASQIHWVSLLETQQSSRVIFIFSLSDLWCGEKGIVLYVLERTGHALCLQLIAKNNFGRAFGNVCHLTCHQGFLFFTFLYFAVLFRWAVYA